jgi:hypothetical protein
MLPRASYVKQATAYYITASRGTVYLNLALTPLTTNLGFFFSEICCSGDGQKDEC